LTDRTLEKSRPVAVGKLVLIDKGRRVQPLSQPFHFTSHRESRYTELDRLFLPLCALHPPSDEVLNHNVCLELWIIRTPLQSFIDTTDYPHPRVLNNHLYDHPTFQSLTLDASFGSTS